MWPISSAIIFQNISGRNGLTYYGYKYNQTVLNKLYWHGQLSLFEPDFQYYMNQDLENVNRGDPWLASLPRQVWKEKMRVRNRKEGDRITRGKSQYVVLNSLEAKGKWRTFLAMIIPFMWEVGSGKGAFVSGMVSKTPTSTISGLIFKVCFSYALDKVLEVGVPNIKLLWVDGSDLTDYFEDGEIDRLYLNFSDPWPKNAMKSVV